MLYLASCPASLGVSDIWGPGVSPSEFIMREGFREAERRTCLAIDEFDGRDDEWTESGRECVDTLECLRRLWIDCHGKKPKRICSSVDMSQNALRAREYCELCGKGSELYAHLEVEQRFVGYEEQKRYSGRFCIQHKSREAGIYGSTHQQAARKVDRFETELRRLRRQSWSFELKRANTGSDILDEYYLRLVVARQFYPDEIGRMRDEARALVDLKVTKPKMQAVVWRALGKTHAEIAVLRGVKQRQTITKMFMKIPSAFRLDLFEFDPVSLRDPQP